MLVFVLHIGGGVVGLVSGTVAAIAPKGGRLHRAAGNVFFVSMLTMAVFAAWPALVVPGQSSNFLGGVFTFYLVATAWATVRRRPGTSGGFEVAAILMPLGMVAALVLFIVQGAKAPPGGAPLGATYVVTFIALLAAGGDLNVILHRGIAGAPRLARHLWRMCVALTFATGSGFTNGLPRVFPGLMHVMPLLFLPMLAPLLLMTCWLIRVRFTGWIPNAA